MIKINILPNKRTAATIAALAAVAILLVLAAIPVWAQTGTPPAAPQELTASASEGGVLLAWQESTNPALLHYALKRAGPITTGTETYQVLTANTGSTNASFKDKTAVPGNTYHYKVASVNATGTSDYSDKAQISLSGTTSNDDAQTDIIDLGDITDTPGAITPPQQSSRQDYRFVLTKTAAVSMTLRNSEGGDERPLLSQQVEAGTYYVTFTLTDYAGYRLHYVANASQTEELETADPVVPEETPTDPQPPPLPTQTDNQAIETDDDHNIEPNFAEQNFVDLGDITDQTGTIPHDPDATAYTFRTTEKRQVTLLLNPNTKKGTSRYLLNYPLRPGFHITPYEGTENSSYTLEYDATQQPSEPRTPRNRHCQIQMQTIHRGRGSGYENSKFDSGTWAIWQSCQGGGGNRATMTVTAEASSGAAAWRFNSDGRYVVKIGPFDYEALSSSKEVWGAVNVTNTHGDTGGRRRYCSVTNVNETETVNLSTTSPKVGQAVTASLSGGDDITSGPTWSWTKSGSSSVIGTGSSYTPGSSDVGKTLTATATYTDPFRSGRNASRTTGTVTGSNRPPTIGSFLARPSIDENSSSGLVKAATLVTDPDGDTVTVSLSSSHFSLRRGRISGNYYNWGIWTTSNTINYESTTTVSGTVTATDAHGLRARRSFSFTVNDLEESENITLSTTSPRVGNRVSAGLSGGDGIVSGPTWAWTRSGSSTVIGRSSSYTPTNNDAGSTLTVTAIYTDTHSAKTAARTTGVVTGNQNRAPNITSSPSNQSVSENRTTNLGTVRATDPDGDRLTYSIYPSPGRISSRTVSTGPLNHETHSSITFTITVYDTAGASDTASFIVTVNDLNETEQVTLSTYSPVLGSSITARLTGGDDIRSGPIWRWTRSGSSATIGSSSSYTPTTSDLNETLTATATYTDTHRSGRTAHATTGRLASNQPPTITSSPSNQSINENTVADLGTIYATDPEGGRLTYSVSPDHSAYVSFVAANTSRARITSKNLDHETRADVGITITVSDSGGQTATTRFIVTVLDRNEPEYLTLSTTSPNVGTALTATLSGGDDITRGPTWSWKNSGSSTVLGTSSSYTPSSNDVGKTLTVTATYTDTHGSKSLSKTTRAVTGTQQANRPPSFTNPPSAANLAENARIGTRVVTLYATDPDNDTLQFSINNSYFTQSKSGNSVRITSATRMNHESIPYTGIRVTVTDEHGLFAQQTLSIYITDLDEPETFNLSWSGSNPTVGNRMTASITPADDLTGSKTWTWQYSSYSYGPWTNIANSNSTYFTPSSFYATDYIRAKIAYTDTHGSKTGYTRISTQVRDNTPTNQRPYFTNSPYNFSVNENTAADTTVGTAITVRDPEGNPTTFQIYDHQDRFKLSATAATTTYLKTTSTPINYESTSSYRIRIRVSEPRSSCCLQTYANITVNDLQETESINLSLPSATNPTTNTPITARLAGGDRTSNVTWQWQSAPTRTGAWTDITAANSSRFTPDSNLVGQHLRATASYTDPFGRSSAQSAGTLAVQRDPHDPTLKSLSITPEDVHDFNPSVNTYHVGITPTQTSATITLEPNTSTATVTVTRSGLSGNISTSSTSGNTKTYTLANLDSGLTTVTIRVTTTRKSATYTVNIGRAVTNTFGWAADKDFNTLRRTSDTFTEPVSITSDGTTMWLAYRGSNVLYAYSLSTTSRTSFNDITLPTGTAPSAIWYHNNLIYVAQAGVRTLKAFRTAGTEDSTKSITLTSRNTRPVALWSNDTTIWVADSSRRRLYAYTFSTKRPDTSKDFNNINSYPSGIHANGYTMWVTDRQNRRLYAYNFQTKARQSTNDFTTLTAADNTIPIGAWASTSKLWVSDRTKNKLYTYNLPTLSNDTSIASFTLDGEEYVTKSEADQDIYKEVTNIIDSAINTITIRIFPTHPDAVAEIATVTSAGSSFASGTKLSYNTTHMGYQPTLQTVGSTHFKVKVTAQNRTTREHHYFTERPSTTDLGLYGFRIKAANESTTTQIRALAHSVPHTVQTITIEPIPKSKDATASITSPQDTDPDTEGHQANLINGPNMFTVRVSDPGTGTQDHTITITRADGTTTWDPRLNIYLLSHNAEPWGIWSNRTTMWVNDYDDGLLYAYSLNTGAYDNVRDLVANPRINQDSYLVDPTGLWSDSEYFWLISRFTWGHTTNNDVTPRIHKLSPSETRKSRVIEHVDQEIDSQINQATGIWSDGTTLWIADEEDHKLYALDLNTLALQSSKDIPLDTSGNDAAQKNEHPTGIWSDHQTMWVADQEDIKLYAYAMVDDPDTQTTETFGSRTPAKDLPLEPVNQEPRGVWGYPGYIQVANDGCPNTDLSGIRFDPCSTGSTSSDTIFTYTVPTSSRTDIKVTIDSNDPITLTPQNDSHTQTVASSATSVTIVTEPLDVRASVSILNPDTDTATPGIQLPPPVGHDPTLVTIVVIAQDEKTTHTYRIHLHRNPSAPTLLASPRNAHQTLHLKWTPPTDLGTSPLTHYEVRYILETADETVEANWSNATDTVTSEIQTLTYALTGLTNGQSYDVQIRAVTDVGHSPWSPTVTATPSGKPTFDDSAAFTATVPENSPPETVVGNPIPATDPDGDAITYSLSGTGADNFLTDNNGEITTSHTAQLDYETTSSYTITVEIRDNRKELVTDTDARAVDNTKQATISITNVQEPGSITFNTNHPQAGSRLIATLTDPDGNIQNRTWAWYIYDNTQNQWTTIPNQTNSSYTPTVSNTDQYLAASVTYDDGAGTQQYLFAAPVHPVLSATAPLQFTKENYEFPLLENLSVKYSVGQVEAGPKQVTYAITTQPAGDHFTINNSGVIKTTKVWDYETPTDRGPHSLTITATRTSDSTTHTTQVSIELANQLEQNEHLTLPNDIPGISWTLVPNTTFIMAKEGTTRKPQYELNIQTKCRNNYYTGRNNHSSWFKVWQDGTAINYPKNLPSENNPFPGTDNPLLQDDLWLSHNLSNPRPVGTDRPGSTCPADYTDLWNDATTLYAMDATNRLIKAHNLTHDGLVITRNRAKDIPVTDDHYRTFWKIRGIWADTDTIWVTASETGINQGYKAAAYGRSTYVRDTSKDYSATPPLTVSQDHVPNQTVRYFPADKWLGDDNLWFLHLSFREATGAFNPAHTAPTTLNTCTATDQTTPDLQMAWTARYAATPLRITGIDSTTKRLYVLSHDSQTIITYDTSQCLPELINSEYNYQEIPNKPDRPHYPGHPQSPTGISTHKDTPQMYFSFSTGEILYISKILPLLDTNTINLPEHSPPFTPVGPRFDPTTTDINQGPYTWEISGTDEASFVYTTSGDHSQYLQIFTKPSVTYEYETQSSYSLTLTVTDADQDTTTATVTVELINLNDQATGDVSISGNAHVGKILTAVHENVADPDGLTTTPTPTYQWLRNGIPISGNTAKTRTLQLDDYNKFVTVRITYTDDADFKNHFTPPAQRITYIPVTASLSQEQVVLKEGDTTTITLDLSETPHRIITIPLTLTPGVNLDTNDYTVSPTELTFTATETTKTVTLTAADDFVDEDNEQLTIKIGTLPIQVTPGNPDQIDLTITDDDTAGVSLTNNTLNLLERASTDYFISLDSEPTHDVTVTLSLPTDRTIAKSEKEVYKGKVGKRDGSVLIWRLRNLCSSVWSRCRTPEGPEGSDIPFKPFCV